MRIVLMVFLLLAAAVPAAALDVGNALRYDVTGGDGVYRATVENRLPVPLTITVSLWLDNMRCDRGERFTAMVPAGSVRTVATLRAIDPQAAHWYRTEEYHWRYGNALATVRDELCRLPYRDGEAYYVIQGYGGSFSHNTDRFQYALDFVMPEGTPLLAVRDGTVAEVREEFSEGGDDPAYMEKANFVSIVHDDGTVADYVHLRYDGAEVSEGERVAAGQLIGYSGNTGYSTTPHLHFMVYRLNDGFTHTGLPIRFATTAGEVQLQEGETYTAVTPGSETAPPVRPATDGKQ